MGSPSHHGTGIHHGTIPAGSRAATRPTEPRHLSASMAKHLSSGWKNVCPAIAFLNVWPQRPYNHCKMRSHHPLSAQSPSILLAKKMKIFLLGLWQRSWARRVKFVSAIFSICPHWATSWFSSCKTGWKKQSAQGTCHFYSLSMWFRSFCFLIFMPQGRHDWYDRRTSRRTGTSWNVGREASKPFLCQVSCKSRMGLLHRIGICIDYYWLLPRLRPSCPYALEQRCIGHAGIVWMEILGPGSIVMGGPQKGWFISWKIPWKAGWFKGTPHLWKPLCLLGG